MIGYAMHRILILLLAITQIGAAAAPVIEPRDRALAVPLVAVLANPDRFDGKLVTVQGFLNLEHEGDAIYPGKSDFDAMLLGNAVWVDGPKAEEPSARRLLSGRHVSLTGRFDADMHGHLGLFAGGLAASDIRVLPSRDQIHATMLPIHSGLPWPLLLLILLPSSLLLSIALAVRRRRTSAKPGSLLTAATLLVATADGIFSVMRLWELPVKIPLLLSVGYGWAAHVPLVELVVGASALMASAFFAFRRNLFLCVVFSAVQLVVPAITEARAFQILEAPFSIYSARQEDHRWTREGPVPPEGRTGGPDWVGL